MTPSELRDEEASERINEAMPAVKTLRPTRVEQLLDDAREAAHIANDKGLGPDEEAIVARVATPIPRWIPVAERLPEADVQVLAWNGETVERVTFFRSSMGDHYWMASNGYYLGCTHWQPLPSPPEVSSDLKSQVGT